MSNINIGNRQNAALPAIYLNPAADEVQIEMYVNDNRLRNLGVPHDGLEKPFALLPVGGEWRRYDLGYVGSFSSRGSNEISDRFHLRLSANQEGLNVEQLKQQGVAFGLEVTGPSGQNPSTVWLQSPDQNYKPID